MGSRFDKSNSLIERGIVEKVELEDTTYYRLSEHGKSLIESLNMAPSR
jgi:predicted transcriptional regulator with HTH domain